MKGLNKLALATAVAAAPFATQAMEPMSDDAMGNTTGQAGVTIELDTQLSIDQIEYSQGDNTGSVLVNNVEVGGLDGGLDPSTGDPSDPTTLDSFGAGLDVAIQVDLPEQDQNLSDFGSKAGEVAKVPPGGGAGSNLSAGDPIPGADIGGDDLNLNDGDALISVQSLNPAEDVPVDVSVDIGDKGGDNNAFQLADSDGNVQATLVSSIEMDLFLTQLDIVARTGDVIADGDATTGTGGSGSLEIEAAFAIDDLDAEFDVAAIGLEDMRMAGAGSLATLKGDNQGTGAVLGAGAAIVSMDIGQGASLSGNGPGETLRVNLDNFQADIWMPTINVGSGDGTTASIGSVGISNLQVTDTELAIYGRE